MHKLNFKNFGLLWLKEKKYINSILTSDTFKKKLLKLLVSRSLWLINLSGLFKDNSEYIYGIINELGLKPESLSAVYVNLSRKPSRTYIWANDSGNRAIFVKILDPIEFLDVTDEIRTQKIISKNIPNVNTFEIIEHGLLDNGSVFLVYESLDMALLSLRRQISDEEISRYFEELKILHPDFNSENIFAIKDSYYVVDFEAIK